MLTLLLLAALAAPDATPEPLTPRTYLGQSSTFYVPALPERVPVQAVRGFRFEGLELGYSLNYGVENLTDEPVANSLWQRNLRPRIYFPGQELPLVQPSLINSGATGPLAAFDGSNEAALFVASDLSDAIIPTGPSGYWGGFSGGQSSQPPEAGLQSSLLLEDQPAAYWPSYADERPWRGRDGLVPLELRPEGHWYRLDATGSHGMAWVDEIHAQVLALEAVIYELDLNGDGVAETELRLEL